MPVLGQVLGFLQQQADIDRTQQTTALESARAKLLNQQVESNTTRDKALQDIAAGEQALQQQRAPKDPNESKSIAQSIDDQIKDAQTQLDHNTDLAQKFKSSKSGDLVAEGLAMDQKNSLLRSNIRQLQTEKLKAVNDEIKQIGGITSSVNDQPSFEAALPMLREIRPDFGKKGAFDRDMNGEPIWGPKTATAMKVMADQTITAQSKIRDQQYQEGIQNRALMTSIAAQSAAALIALRNAETAKAQAGTDKIRASITPKDKSDAKLKATRGPNSNDVKAATADVLATDGWDDVGKWDPNSVTALGHDVAALSNNIVAAGLDKGERISLDDARQEAISRLKPYVNEAKKPESGGWKMAPKILKDLTGHETDSVLKYSRPGTNAAAGRIDTGTGKDKPPAGTSDAPKNADEYLTSIGVK